MADKTTQVNDGLGLPYSLEAEQSVLGAVLVDETGEVHAKEAPKGTVINSVGAGDSMVAGFLAGWMEKKKYEHAFYMGLATGSASAFSENLATSEEVAKVYQKSFIS